MSRTEHSFDVEFGRTRAEVDRVLLGMPDNRLQARRVITREWGFVPRPEELQTIVRIAHEPIGRGPLREFSRTTLSLRVLVDHELRELLDSQDLDVRRLEEIAAIMPHLLRAVTALETKLRTTIETVAFEEREFLLQIGNALIPQQEMLVAAEILAPRLAEFARAENEEQIRAVAHSLTDPEIAQLVRIFCRAAGTDQAPDEDSDDDPSRVCIDALALSSLIHDDLVEWNRALPACRQQNDEPDDDGAGRRDLLERLKRTKTAYHVISGRLQKHQDTALVAGLDSFADEMRRVQRSLFSTYLQLARVLNNPEPASPDESDTPDTMNRLLEECSSQDALVEAQQATRVTPEQLYVDVLKDRAPQARTVFEIETRRSAGELRRERRRLQMLTTIAGVLFVACVAFYGLRWTGRGNDSLAAPLDKLPQTLILSNAMAVGPMMYAEVSHWSWDGMSEAERTRSILELGQSAADQGYESVCLVDENRHELARWTQLTGVTLVEQDPVPEPGA